MKKGSKRHETPHGNVLMRRSRAKIHQKKIQPVQKTFRNACANLPGISETKNAKIEISASEYFPGLQTSKGIVKIALFW